MNMVRKVLEGMGDTWVYNYQAYVLVLFTLFFLGVCVWAFRIRKVHVDHMGALPLADDNNSSTGD